MKHNIIFLVLSALLCGACAPKVTERVFPIPESTFKPESSDVVLHLRLREFGEKPPALNWQESISTAEYFSQADSLMILGEKLRRPQLREQGLEWIRRFYQNPDLQNWGDMALSPFMNLAATETEQQVQSSLNDVLLQMEEARPVIIAHVLGLADQLSTVPQEDLDGLILRAEEFNALLVAEIPKMALPPVLEEGFRTELIRSTDPLFVTLRALVAELKEVKTLSQTMAIIQKGVDQFQVKLESTLAKSIAQGQSLGRDLDQMNDAQGALQVIVDVWRLLTPAERLEKFKPANEQLYGFLVKQDESELECLRTRGCLGGIIDGIAKKLFVLPKIEKYGVHRLKEEMNQQTLDYVLATIRSFAQDFVKTLPQTFADNINEAWLAKAMKLVAVRADFQTYVRKIAKTWSTNLLPASEGKIAGFENSFLQIETLDQGQLALQSNSNKQTISGELIGYSLLANVHLTENAPVQNEETLRAAFSQISKLVAITGYRNTRNQLIPALLMPVNHQDKLLDINKFEEAKDAKYSFRIPDSLSLQDAFHASSDLPYAKNFSVSALSAQIKGLSRLLYFTADWRKSSYDTLLTPIKAQDLTNDAQDPALQQSLFPKDKIFALNVGAVSVLLQDIVKKMTPVFLLTLDDKVMWADQYSESSPENPIMAGVVDIQNGQRSDRARSQDVAKFLLSISEFIEALEGIEKTQSSIILAKNPTGTRPLDSLINGKEDLKRLSIALANFISNKMKLKSGLIKTEYSLKKHDLSEDEIVRVETQATAISALVKAYELTGIEAYLWSAQNVYFAMNKNLFNVKSEFYHNSDGSELSVPEKISTLRALSELQAYLPTESRMQLTRVMQPWLEALAGLR